MVRADTSASNPKKSNFHFRVFVTFFSKKTTYSNPMDLDSFTAKLAVCLHSMARRKPVESCTKRHKGRYTKLHTELNAKEMIETENVKEKQITQNQDFFPVRVTPLLSYASVANGVVNEYNHNQIRQLLGELKSVCSLIGIE